MSTVLAGPPTECCLRTVHHTGEARGTIEEYAGVKTYVTRPPSGDSSKVILYFSDLFGPMYINAQLCMDYWASNGELLWFFHRLLDNLACGPGFV